ncbi:hypothetical protein J2Z69_003438 [Paenibacillus shirakamiensis]|uniref:YheC/YheD family protein n=1 Tax=Paenibacillus shirakamiensis TaxID=1265935 RepID=A0ABS4JML0_9BACL|nr:hypothetical protein [Paenibacillus shirakamiensis]
MIIQRIASKWQKTLVLQQRSSLLPYIPETRKYSAEELNQLLLEYSMIYIKPDRGTYGNGVMCIEKLSKQTDQEEEFFYKLKSGIQTEEFNSVEGLHQTIMDKIKGQEYLIQQGIYLLKHQRRKFDIRVLAQKNLQRKWETTGYIGRVAALQKIITNHHSGGTTYPVEFLLGKHMNSSQLQLAMSELRQLGTQVGYQLEKVYPNIKEIGLDIAIDHDFKAWILEVNTLPALFPFKFLKDKHIYSKIRRYAIAYGRYSGSKK